MFYFLFFLHFLLILSFFVVDYFKKKTKDFVMRIGHVDNGPVQGECFFLSHVTYFDIVSKTFFLS